MLSLSSAKTLAASQIQKAQSKYKKCYDKKTKLSTFKVGQWVLVRFPHEETGRMRKLSRPWHGPFRVVSRQDPDITVSNVYFPNDTHIKVHTNIIMVVINICSYCKFTVMFESLQIWNSQVKSLQLCC